MLFSIHSKIIYYLIIYYSKNIIENRVNSNYKKKIKKNKYIIYITQN